MVDFRVEGLDEIVSKLGTVADKLEANIYKEASREVTKLVDDIRDDQLSGRSGNYGVDRVTGRLADSLIGEVDIVGDGIETRVLSDVEYINVHQYGTMHHPKRLYIVEEFENRIGSILEGILDNTLEETLA